MSIGLVLAMATISAQNDAVALDVVCEPMHVSACACPVPRENLHLQICDSVRGNGSKTARLA